MNCKSGDLAYLSSECVDEGKIVEVLRPVARAGLPAWWCKSRDAIQCQGERSKADVLTTEFCCEDRYLRPISGVPVLDETHIETNVPEAVKLAWGIEAPVLS